MKRVPTISLACKNNHLVALQNIQLMPQKLMAIGIVYYTTQTMRQKYAPPREMHPFIFLWPAQQAGTRTRFERLFARSKSMWKKSSGPVNRIYTPQLDFV